MADWFACCPKGGRGSGLLIEISQHIGSLEDYELIILIPISNQTIAGKEVRCYNRYSMIKMVLLAL
jgi:hypothetical protein